MRSLALPGLLVRNLKKELLPVREPPRFLFSIFWASILEPKTMPEMPETPPRMKRCVYRAGIRTNVGDC